MFDHVIKDPDWRAALHGQPVMKVSYDGEAFTVCTAKAIHAVWGQFAGRGDNPFNLALMIKHKRSWDAWKELPWFAVCDSEERELFCIQSPFSDNAIKLIHRNPLYYYTLTMKTQKEKLRKQSIHHCNKKNKIIRSKLT